MDYMIKQTGNWTKTKADCLIMPIYDTSHTTDVFKFIDEQMNGQLNTLKKRKDLPAKAAQIQLLFAPEGATFKYLLLMGCGKKTTNADFQNIINAASGALLKTQSQSATLLLNLFNIESLTENTLIKQAVNLLETSTYQYDATLSKKPDIPKLKKIHVVTGLTTAKGKVYAAQGKAMAEGVKIAMDLGNLPGNICTPTYLADKAVRMAEEFESLTTSVLTEPQMKKLKMESLLSVSAGTEEPARLIVMEYKGAAEKTKPTVLVGKGVTFDSGGISLKPGARMDEMKYDMCGAASVFGTVHAAAALALKINLVGIVGAVENMPSGKATKPGDVVTSLSGKTIEVLNTDAEGRLVLCDALTYAERYKPATVIDIATLTGACVVALGNHASGLYSNQDDLREKLQQAGNEVYDRAWPMPLWKEYDKQLESNFADVGNIGGPEAGSVTAACFLARFTENYHWAHLDIAGSAWKSGAKKGATGRPVSLLTQYLINHG